MTNILPQAAPRRMLLLKAGKIAHQAGYYLHQGRWHSIKQDKPAPKGAPVAAHPHVAGQHTPEKHFTDAEWEQLKLPDSNSNAGTYNAQLEKLKQHSEAGHVTGILGSGFGTNTYGVKLSKIANHLLTLHGSQHQVTPGQKAGEHEAVKVAPKGAAIPSASELAAPSIPQKASVDKSKHHSEKSAYHATLAQEHNKASTLAGSSGSPAASKAHWEAYHAHKHAAWMHENHEKTKGDIEGSSGTADALTTSANSTKWKVGAVPTKVGSGGSADLSHTPASQKAADPSPADTPKFDDTFGKAKFYDKVAAKLKEMADAGDLVALKAAHDENKGTTAWQGKTVNSKILVAYHAELVGKLAGKPDAQPISEPVAAVQPEPAPAEPKKPRQVLGKLIKQKMAETQAAAAPALIDFDSHKLPDTNTNSGTFNKKLSEIKTAYEAGDVAKLEGMTFGKNTYNVKASKIAAQAIAALKGSAPAAAAPAPAPQKPSAPLPKIPKFDDFNHEVVAKKWAKMLEDGNPGEMKASVTKLAGNVSSSAQLSADKDTTKLLAFGISALKAGGHLSPELSKMLDDMVAGAKPEPQALSAEQKQSIMDWLDVEEDQNGTPPEHMAAQALYHSLDADTKKALIKEQIANAKKKADDSPKEGDTKEGADGTLVFHNGRWHKQQDVLPEPAATGLDAITVPNFHGKGLKSQSADALTAVANDLLQSAKNDGAAGLKGKVTQHKTGKKAGWFTVKTMGYKVTVSGQSATFEANNDFHKFVAQIVAATGKPKKASKAKAAPAPEPAQPAAPSIESMDGWAQTGPQGGSNPGGRYKDHDGVEWYCKFPSDPDVAKSEILASKLYAAAGVAGQDAKLITKDGKVGIASRWVSVKQAGSPAELAKVDGVRAGFGVDAWLANWDVVGLGYDNLQIGADGKAVRVDAGGSLTYRAQGGKKAFGGTVVELDSLLDKSVNPQAAAVFGGMTKADITAAVAKVAAISDASIRILCATHGPGDTANRKALADLLIARKADMLSKHPQASKKVKKRLNPESLPVNDSALPKPHDFANWQGAGKGLSSQPHINSANMAVEQEILALAKTGNLTKLKEFQFHQIDKNTGNATGQLSPIAQHPSKHVVQFHADLVQMLDEIANPPRALKIFRETDVGTLDELEVAFPPKPFGTTVSSVKSNEKLGFWVVLGGVHGAGKFKPAKVMDFSHSAVQAAYQKHQQASPLAKHFISSVQSSGSYNDLFRDGKLKDHQGNLLADVAKAAHEHATSQPEGTSLYRWQNMPDEMVKKIMSAPDGSVFQATGPMCTSYSSSATSGFGQHRVTIRYAKGAKAVESFGSGQFKGEKEVTTLPNSRFVILSKQMVPNEKYPGKQRLELEVLMLPPDLGL